MSNPVGWSSIYPPQYMSNQDPNVSPVASRALMSDVQKLGLLGRRGPVTGADLPAVEARGQGLMDNAMTVAGAVNPVGIRAFHGSPHTFDRFDMSKLGTGEGAQAYGHGLYFAGEEGVARSYRDALAPGAQMTLNGSPLSAATDPVKRVAMWIRNTGAHPEEIARISEQRAAKAATEAEQLGLDGRAFAEEHSAMADAARKLAQVGKWELGTAPNGSMYEVNLRTSPERLLDWDKPLFKQGETGIRAKETAEAITGFPGDAIYNSSMGAEAMKAILQRPEAAKELQKHGIDGIQYLDGGSRAAGEGSRNYVMFDDKLVEILRRYGLLGMLGGGAAGGGLLAQEPAR